MLPVSPNAISLKNVNQELLKTSPYEQTVSLNDTDVRTLFGVASGAISMSNGHGKSNSFIFNLSTTDNLVNLREAALAQTPIWDGNKNVIAIVPAGTTVGPYALATEGIVINGSFPNGVKLINNGTIRGGMGTSGTPGTHGARGIGGLGVGAGAGNPGTAGGAAGNGGPGGNGYAAIVASVAVTIDNLGSINGGAGGSGGSAGVRSGGGGGAGGGASTFDKNTGTITYAGGNGGNGYSVATGGPTAGGPGDGGAAGAGGAGGASGAAGSAGANGASGLGGAGGAAGAAGSAGANGSQGNYLTGNANVTWINVGTRNGGVS